MDIENSINTHLQSLEIKMIYLDYTVTWELKKTKTKIKTCFQTSWIHEISQKKNNMGFYLQIVSLLYWIEIINKEKISEMTQALLSRGELVARYNTADE